MHVRERFDRGAAVAALLLLTSGCADKSVAPSMNNESGGAHARTAESGLGPIEVAPGIFKRTGDHATQSLVALVEGIRATDRVYEPSSSAVAFARARIDIAPQPPSRIEEAGFVEIDGIRYWEENGELYPPAGTPAIIHSAFTDGYLGISPIGSGVGGRIVAGFDFTGAYGNQALAWAITKLDGSPIQSGTDPSFGERTTPFFRTRHKILGSLDITGLPPCDLRMSASTSHEAWYAGDYSFNGEGSIGSGSGSLSIKRSRSGVAKVSSGLGPPEELRCTAHPPRRVSVNVGSTTIAVGEQTIASAAALLDDDSPASGCSSFTWSSSNNAVATVDQSGTIVGTGSGTVSISASCLGITGTAGLTVAETNCADPAAQNYGVPGTCAYPPNTGGGGDDGDDDECISTQRLGLAAYGRSIPGTCPDEGAGGEVCEWKGTIVTVNGQYTYEEWKYVCTKASREYPGLLRAFGEYSSKTRGARGAGDNKFADATQTSRAPRKSRLTIVDTKGPHRTAAVGLLRVAVSGTPTLIAVDLEKASARDLAASIRLALALRERPRSNVFAYIAGPAPAITAPELTRATAYLKSLGSARVQKVDAVGDARVIEIEVDAP